MRKKHISSLNLLWAGLILLVFSSMAQAQYEDGSVVGTIRDTSGAAVAGATVTVTNTATGIQNNVTSNGSGDYEVPSVRAGLYRISAAASGFATAIAENITVSVGNRQRIDLKLKVGAADDNRRSDRRGAADRDGDQRARADGHGLPERGAAAGHPQLLRLACAGSGLAPGANCRHHHVHQLAWCAPAPTTSTAQRSMFNNFLLDGMDNNAYGESNQGFDNQIIAVPPDSVAQFQVVTNNESAEYGRVFRRHHQRGLAERDQPLPRRRCMSSSATLTSTQQASSSPRGRRFRHNRHRS